MSPQTEAGAERTLDHEFDQTALHNHAKDAECPTCNAVSEIHKVPEFTGTPVANENETIARLERELNEANERIKAFDRFMANLAAHIDGMQQSVENAIRSRTEFPKAA